MNSPKVISLNPVDELIAEFNEVSMELASIVSWAQGMQENGLVSNGAKMSKQRIVEIRKKIKLLEKRCKPARDMLLALKDSGHFDRRNCTPIYFNKGK